MKDEIDGNTGKEDVEVEKLKRERRTRGEFEKIQSKGRKRGKCKNGTELLSEIAQNPIKMNIKYLFIIYNRFLLLLSLCHYNTYFASILMFV